MLLRRHNLNLLPILRELLRTRSVSETSKIVGLSQPAVSAALAKLRETYNDSLLIMVGRKLELTEKGEELILQAERACLEVEVLFSPAVFDPYTAQRRFVVGTADYVAYLLAPVVSEILEREAPLVSVQFVDVPPDSRLDLARGRIDVVTIPSDTAAYLQDETKGTPLFDDDMVVIASRRHRKFADELTMGVYESSRHARFKLNWDALGHQDHSFNAANVHTEDQIMVQQFALLPSIVERSGIIALIYRSLAERFARMHEIDLFPPPFEIPTSTVTAYWWGSKEKDPAHVWFCGLLTRASAELGLSIG